MKECPDCQSYIYVGTHCQKCEDEFKFKFGLEASRNRKQQQNTIEWKIKPNSNNCGRRKD